MKNIKTARRKQIEYSIEQRSASARYKYNKKNKKNKYDDIALLFRLRNKRGFTNKSHGIELTDDVIVLDKDGNRILNNQNPIA